MLKKLLWEKRQNLSLWRPQICDLTVKDYPKTSGRIENFNSAYSGDSDLLKHLMMATQRDSTLNRLL